MAPVADIAGATERFPSLTRLAGRASLADLARRAGPLIAGSVLPFVLVLYLALKGGGYDVIVRSEVGIAAWWIVLVGAVAGLLPVARIGAAGWTALGLLAALAVWTALGIGWSESAERSVAELGRVATYLGVLALALVVQGPGALRRTVGAVGAAIALVAALALLSRLQPQWFPANETSQFLPGTQERLSYPVNYWNGLAALIAIGVPLLLWAASSARTILARSLAAAALPAAALAAFLTLSRGGAVALAVALVVLLALYPRRLALLPPLLLAAGGSAILIAAALQRDALQQGFLGPVAARQGDEMLAIALVVCAGVGLVAAALALAERHRFIRWPSPPRRIALPAFAAAALIAAIAALAGGLPGQASERWSEFKSLEGTGAGPERFAAAQGSGRYQLWQSAVDANATAPMSGIGAGTYEYWWTREGTLPTFVRDAHSLYLESLGELGIVGFALVVALVGGILGLGAARALRRRRERTSLLAAATAGAAAFAVAAAADWVWELTVVTVAFLLLAAAIVGPDARGGAQGPPSRERRGRIATAAVLSVLALGSLVAIAIPMAGTTSVRESWSAAEQAALTDALGKARTAQSIQPYAATPKLQEAMVLELNGDLGAAATAARAATRDEPTNWRTWLVRSRLEAQRGNAQQAVNSYREARSLNPRSILFQR
jgi:hypothetical protein